MGSSAPKYFELAEARSDGLMNIGRAAEAAGVSAKMIRHYESIGLLPGATRTVAGYRVYRDSDVHTLRFIRRSRDLGFSIKEIGALLGLWNNRRRASSEVRKLAARHMQQLDTRIAELQSMRDTLAHLVHHCHGDDRPDCPILHDLASDPPVAPVAQVDHADHATHAARAPAAVVSRRPRSRPAATRG